MNLLRINIRGGYEAWKWSLSVLVRNPLYVLALAVLCGLWGLAGYEWLSLPESSGLVLLLALIWILALAAVAIAVLAGTVGSSSDAADGARNSLSLSGILNFGSRRFVRSLIIAVGGVLLSLTLSAFFGWMNDQTVEVASFSTFHAQKPVSHIFLGSIFWIFEALIWIALAGFLTNLLIILLHSGWGEARRTSARTLLRSIAGRVLFTGVVCVAVFGGLTWLVGNWHPLVRPGFWDYAQLALRISAALLLLAIGWLFWTLSLARLTPRPVTGSSATGQVASLTPS